MLSIKQRIILFLFGCIGSRLFLSYLAKYLRGIYSTILSLLILIMGMGFFIIYWGDLRKTGLETGGNPIWWNSIRPIHGTFYVTSSILLSYNHYCWSSQVLLIDTLFGLSAFILHHMNSYR